MPVLLTDTAGKVQWQSKRQTLWGNVPQTRAESEISQPLRFAGQYHDSETGLHYNTFRYYDPNSGRFTQSDPIGLAGGLNLYQYAPNPLGWIDPWGLKCWSSARRSYWKSEAKAAPKGMYSSVNMSRMRLGLAPKIQVREYHFRTGKIRVRNVSLELNHRHWPQRDGKYIDIPFNLEKVTPWEHAAKDPYRHTGSDLIEILQNIGNYTGVK